MGKGSSRLSTDGGDELKSNPFGALDSAGLPSGPPAGSAERVSEPARDTGRSRGRLDVRREKAGRGGKTVTVVSGWKGIGEEEKARLAKTIQKRCGVGGAVKGGCIEIQGDKREEARSVLEAAGFRVVFAGG